ncbi:hypothetical protein FOCG_17634 [Fusarium oxysporum f. sp. radicis-lycopersici 26381]|nr:hypothetical protein FOCG_17634 [Fusarium oxysporum f. sp. radicis-lycopersici 26381]
MPNFDASLFEITQISSTVTVDDAVTFFKEHGIFYYADANIAKQVERFGIQPLRDPNFLRELTLEDPRLARILESYEPTYTYVLGPHRGAFYCYSVKPNQDHANQAIVYIWTKRTWLEFFPTSHTGPLRGVSASNGLYQVPYSWYRTKPWIQDEAEKERLKEIPIEMDEGGVLIVHPRMTFAVQEGFAVAYGCRKRDAGDPDTQQ